MCIVSNIGDYYQRWPQQPNTAPIQPFPWPQAAPAELPWTREALDALKAILEAVKALDAKLGLPDCEDPKKLEWMESVERRVKALEDDKGGK
jgi:hypothetical protein